MSNKYIDIDRNINAQILKRLDELEKKVNSFSPKADLPLPMLPFKQRY